MATQYVAIDLHQKRWGVDGLFPATPGGDCSRGFFRHLFRHFGANGPLKLTRLTVGGRLVASGIHFDDGERCEAEGFERRRMTE